MSVVFGRPKLTDNKTVRVEIKREKIQCGPKHFGQYRYSALVLESVDWYHFTNESYMELFQWNNFQNSSCFLGLDTTLTSFNFFVIQKYDMKDVLS